MFKTCSFSSIKIQPDSKHLKTLNESQCQTEKLSFDSKEVQASSFNSQFCQTDFVQVEQSNFTTTLSQEAYQKLNIFLKSIENDMLAYLRENLRQAALFKNYFSSRNEFGECNVKVLATFLPDKLASDLEVTSLSWNSNASLLAASYGQFQHEDWCSHKGWVYTFSMRQTDLAKSFTFSMDFSACCTQVLYHPKNRSILAIATYSGEIIILGADGVLARLITVEQQPITCLCWQSIQNDNQLVSASSSGHVTFWNLDLVPIHRFFLSKSRLPKMSLRGALVANQKSKPVGITTLRIFNDKIEKFLAGTETGIIFLCDKSCKVVVNEEHRHGNFNCQEKVPLIDPVIETYQAHIGPISVASLFTTDPNYYLTCGCDGKIRLKNLNRVETILELDLGSGNITCGDWSNQKTDQWLCATHDGSLLAVDIEMDQSGKRRETSPTMTLWHCDSKSICVTSLAMNPNLDKRGVLALGDSKGRCIILHIM